ncbi:flagellar filament capping protein FliD [Planktomarina sp.]|nr:flagellar filament capping protein FliD [Planktomarina sp.]
MPAIAENDYISQINQNGSGLNIPQIVGAIVDAEITPTKTPVLKDQEKVVAAISGLAILKESAELTQKNIAALKSGETSITTKSTDTNIIEVEVTNQAELKVGVSKVTAISQLATAMSHSIPAAGSDTAAFNTANATLTKDYSLEIQFGTYVLTANGQSFTRDITSVPPPAVTNISFAAGDSISAVAATLSRIEGLSATVVNTDGADHKIMITGDTGLSNAFQIKTLPQTFSHTNIANLEQYTIASTGTEQIRANAIINGQDYKIVSTDGDNEAATGMINGAQYKIVSTDGATDNASTIDSGRWYKIVSDNNGSVSNATSIQNGGYYEVVAADNGATTNATAIQAGKTYRISSAGDTDWTSFGYTGAPIFTASTNGTGASGTGVAIETTDFSRLNAGANVVAGGRFQANVNASGVLNVGPGTVKHYTNFADYGTVSGSQFKATQSALANVGTGRVTPFTNFDEDFNAANNTAGTIFTANTDVDADTGPGVVTSYTDFATIFNGAAVAAGGMTNAVGKIFTANASGTAIHGTGKIIRFTDYTRYGHTGAALTELTGNFTAGAPGNGAFGSGQVHQVTEHVSGTNDYRIFDVWKDQANGDSNQLRTQDLNAKDLVFDLNGLEVKRENNVVTDVVDGVSFEIKKTSTVGAEIVTGASKESVQATVQSYIDEVNAYRADLAALMKYDRTGEKNGDLYQDDYAKSRLRALESFMLSPIMGYTSLDKTGSSSINAFVEASPVYLSQLGFRTQKDGSYGLDQVAFDRTFENAPGNFDALFKDHAFSTHPEITVVWDGGHAGTGAGIYEFHHSDDKYHGTSDGNAIYPRGIRDTNELLYRSALVDGTYTYSKDVAGSSDIFPGLQIRATRDNLGDDINMDIHLGQSFSTLFSKFHDDILNNTYVHRRQVESLTNQSFALEKRLEAIELRHQMLSQQYNDQFQDMEASITAFNSTGDFLTNYIDNYNNR